MTEKKSELFDIYEKARHKLDTARLLLSNDRNDDAVSRAYYAVYHGISAVLLSKRLVFSSHSQVIGAFNREFVKTGIFPADFTKKIQRLFDFRQAGDYAVDPSIDHETAKTLTDDAGMIIESIERYLQSIGAL